MEKESKKAVGKVVVLFSIALVAFILGYFFDIIRGIKGSTNDKETANEKCKDTSVKKLDVSDERIKKIVDTYSETKFLEPGFILMSTDYGKSRGDVFLDDFILGGYIKSSNYTLVEKNYDCDKNFDEYLNNKTLLAYITEDKVKESYSELGSMKYYETPERIYDLKGTLVYEYNKDNKRFEARNCLGGIGYVQQYEYKFTVEEAEEICDTIKIKLKIVKTPHPDFGSGVYPSTEYHEFYFVKENNNYVYDKGSMIKLG